MYNYSIMLLKGLAMTKSEYQKQYREKNKDKIEQYRKEYYAKNREKLIEYQKQKAIENPEEYKKRNREYNKKRRNDPTKFVDLMYRAMVDRSKKKDMVVEVDREYLTKLIKKSNNICALSGLTMTMERKSPFLISPDRKNSSKGYVKGNIQMVASCVNIAKNKLTTKEFVEICKAVAAKNA